MKSEQKLLKVERKVLHFKKQAARVITARWLWFGLGLITTAICWEQREGFIFKAGMGLWLLGFILSSVFYHRLDSRRRHWEVLSHLLKLAGARAKLAWEKLPLYRGPEVSDLSAQGYDQQTATDLNMTGPRSILHLMDSCVSYSGQQQLLGHLLNPAPELAAITERQQMIKELLPLAIFRTKFKLLGQLQSPELLKGEALLNPFAGSLHNFKVKILIGSLVVLQITSIFLLIASAGWEWRPYYLFAMALVYLNYQLLKTMAAEPFSTALEFQNTLERVFPLFNLIEKLPVNKNSSLYSEFSPFLERPPTQMLKRLNLIVSLLSVRANPLLGIVLNLFLPWDHGLLLWLESVRQKSYPHMKRWMEALGNIEALVSLTDYCENFGGVFPEFLATADSCYLRALNFGHPLIVPEKRINNSFELMQQTPVVLVTGSNMAGKSTFLRTLGLNVALARAGVTVAAEKFQLQSLQVMTLIKAQDFLEKEMSLFYFEVSRLKEILERGRKSSESRPLLFLIDEIYRGTNNEERYQGAVAYLRQFAGLANCCGLLTTHDINIARTLEDNAQIINYYFSENYIDGALKYDYKIQNGICHSTNALRIMQREGLPT